MNRFAEVKALVNGGTATVGSFSPSQAEPNQNECIKGLIRNLDWQNVTARLGILM